MAHAEYNVHNIMINNPISYKLHNILGTSILMCVTRRYIIFKPRYVHVNIKIHRLPITIYNIICLINIAMITKTREILLIKNMYQKKKKKKTQSDKVKISIFRVSTNFTK